jgi:cell division protease FtsH|tara:strand:+ start:620 stop:2644 length:2025 start_codon:yes stop_codon:yes gene_type:complete
MSEPTKSPNGRPGGKNQPDRFQPKLILFYLAIAAVIFVLWDQSSKGRNDTEISIHEVVLKTGEGLVESAKIFPNPNGGADYYDIVGFLRQEDAAAPEGFVSVPFKADGKLVDEQYLILQQSGKFEENESNSLMPLLAGLIPFLLIIGLLYFLFVRQLRMAGRGALSFGKSKAKLLTREKDKTTFSDVAGCDEAKEEVSEVIDFLKDPKKFQRIGARIPTGILMVGPPGTGKTLLAKAVAGEAEVPFFSISGSDFVEMFVGVGASRVRDMFEQGRKSAPCLIFIDEIDAVGRQRGAGVGGGNDEREQTLNSLLVEMDGFDTQEGVIIMAATNRPDVLDKALLRPGRFDREVAIGLPDLRGREDILKVHAKKIKLSEAVDLRNIARATPGFAGADLANLLNEGALMAARKNKSQVEMIDIHDAKDKISFGRERRQLMDEEDQRMTAFHEAGHALIAALLYKTKIKLYKVTIIPRGRALGLTMSTATKDILGQSKNELFDDICMAMGGRVGEEVETGDFSNGAAMDIKMATSTARHMVCDWGMSSLGPIAFGDNEEHLFLGREISKTHNLSEETAKRIDEEISTIISGQFDRAKALIEEHRDALIKIAEALLEYETIEGKHVQEIVEFGEIRSEVISTKTEELKQEEVETEEKAAKKKEADESEELPPAVDGAQAMA